MIIKKMFVAATFIVCFFCIPNKNFLKKSEIKYILNNF